MDFIQPFVRYAAKSNYFIDDTVDYASIMNDF